MPNWDCWCGAGFHLPQRLTSSLVLESEKFCGRECLLTFIGTDPALIFPQIAEMRYDVGNCDDFRMGPGTLYDNVTDGHYRSGSEAVFARFLQAHKITYRYEHTTLVFTKRHSDNERYYVPDFQVCATGVYFEVKGLWAIRAKSKVKDAIAAGVPLVLIPDYLIRILKREVGSVRAIR